MLEIAGLHRVDGLVKGMHWIQRRLLFLKNALNIHKRKSCRKSRAHLSSQDFSRKRNPPKEIPVFWFMVHSCNLVYRPGSQIRVTSAAHPNKHVHPESRKRRCRFVATESICCAISICYYRTVKKKCGARENGCRTMDAFFTIVRKISIPMMYARNTRTPKISSGSTASGALLLLLVSFSCALLETLANKICRSSH